MSPKAHTPFGQQSSTARRSLLFAATSVLLLLVLAVTTTSFGRTDELSAGESVPIGAVEEDDRRVVRELEVPIANTSSDPITPSRTDSATPTSLGEDRPPEADVPAVESPTANDDAGPLVETTVSPSTTTTSTVSPTSIVSPTSTVSAVQVQSADSAVPSTIPVTANLPTAQPSSTTTSPPAAVQQSTSDLQAAWAARKQPMSKDFTLMGMVENAQQMGFGQSDSQVRSALEDIFGPVKYANSENWHNLAVVEDPTGDYIRYRSNVGNNSRQQFNVPIAPSQESYLVYRFQLEPGFDAGDGDGSHGSPSWGTGIKMPGLMRGTPAANTGGNHTEGGFSGRLMIRGTRQSDGRNDLPREGISLAAYVYGQRIDGADITSGFGEDYYFLDGFDTTPFEGIRSGINGGVGDPRIWDLEEGRWVTVVLGYRVEGGNGWFKAWTMTEGIDTDPQPRLFIDKIDWTGGWEGPDSLLMQQYYGGSGPVWHPDTQSYIRFKDFGVFRNQTSALSFAGQK